MAAIDPETLLRDYLAAFEAQELERCVGFYDDDATLSFHLSPFRGANAIERWHRNRFEARARVRVERISVAGNTATVEAVVTSDKLRAWKLDSLRGKATFTFRENKIAEAELGLSGFHLDLLGV